MDGCWMDVGWMLDGWMVRESGIKANSAHFSWSLAELGKKTSTLDPEIDIKCQFLGNHQETDIMDQILERVCLEIYRKNANILCI